MLPDPLHPAVVHVPIGLSVVVPLIAAGVLLAIRRNALPARAWTLVVALQVVLAGSAWLARETGEDQHDRVEKVVDHEHIEAHEEAGERVAITATIAALLFAAGLLPDRIGRIGRVVGALASLGVLAAAVAAGHSGGELVYRYGAARAYTGTEAGTSAEPAEHPR